MPRKAYSFSYCAEPWGIYSMFVEDEQTVQFITKTTGLHFGDGRGIELVLEPGQFTIDELEVDPKVFAFLEKNPIGPLPDKIQWIIDDSIDHAHGDPASWVDDEDFLYVLDRQSTPDSNELVAFYDSCMEAAMEDPEYWCNEFPDFWKEVEIMSPGLYQDFLKLCKDKGLVFEWEKEGEKKEGAKEKEKEDVADYKRVCLKQVGAVANMY